MIGEKIIELDIENVIIGGDFNLVMDLQKDKTGGRNITHTLARQTIQSLQHELNLIDIWREQHKQENNYTWKRLNPEPILERLDFFLISKGLLGNIINTGIHTGIKSDHDMPYLIFAPSKHKQGPGFWKFNTTLLEDKEYIDQTVKLIREEKAKKYKNIMEKWDCIKLSIRGHTIQYSSRKKRSRNNKLVALERKLKMLYQDLIDGSEIFSSENIKTQIGKVEQDIQEIVEYKLRGSMIRSRKDWHNNGEKKSKFFFNLEKSNYKKKNRYQIRLGTTGEITNDRDKILQEQYLFYENLYTSEHVELSDSFFDDINIPKLTEADNDLLIEPITMEEIKGILWEMKKDKVPGTEGFPPEFYRTFWEEVKHILTQVIIDAAKEGFTQTVRRAIIALMEKANKDLLDISCWRPLSLCNTDLKILSKLLAHRLNKVLPKIIHNDQTGFLKNRGLTDNVIDLISAVEHCELNEIDALLVSYDLEKAFDRVEWNVLLKIMQKFGFHQEYIEMIKTLLTGLESCTINCGFTSPYINVTRGLMQGSPISSSLFLLTVEILGLKIRQNPNIEGIQVDEAIKDKKIGQYADDLWSLIKASQENLNNLLKTVQNFCAGTGLRINYNKTQIVRIGSLRNSDATYYTEKPIHWSPSTKILGITINPNREEMLKQNFDSLLAKMAKVLNVWKSRTLTLMGRIQVVNSLIISMCTQKFTCLTTPHESFFKEARKTITNFLWKGGKAKIAYNKLVQDICKGGLKLIDIKSKEISLKAAWVGKSLDENNKLCFWRHIAEYSIGGKIPDIWEYNMNRKDIENYAKIKNSIWTSIWKSWSFVRYKKANQITDIQEILNQNIALNSTIKIADKVIRQSVWENYGIKRIEHIYDKNKNDFIPYAQLKNKIQVHGLGDIGHFLKYAALIDAIPNEWKQILRQNAISDVGENVEIQEIDIGLDSKITPKIIYKIINPKINVTTDDARIKWNLELNTDLSITEWETLRKNNYNISPAVKYKDFQYRLLSNRIVTNVTRNRWDSNVDNTCTHCKRNPETIVHLFCECPVAKKLWKAVTKWLRYFFEIGFCHGKDTIIYNNYKGQHAEFVNTVIIVTKQIIYAKKCNESKPEFTQIAKKTFDLFGLFVQYSCGNKRNRISPEFIAKGEPLQAKPRQTGNYASFRGSQVVKTPFIPVLPKIEPPQPKVSDFSILFFFFFG